VSAAAAVAAAAAAECDVTRVTRERCLPERVQDQPAQRIGGQDVQCMAGGSVVLRIASRCSCS